MSEQIYTLEQFAPAYPQSGRCVRVHKGRFEANRDYLNPSMITTREFYAVDDREARKKGPSGRRGFRRTLVWPRLIASLIVKCEETYGNKGDTMPSNAAKTPQSNDSNCARSRTHTRKLRYGRWGLLEDPRGGHCTLTYQGRTLLGEVKDVYRSEGYRCGLNLRVVFMNGEPWPIDPVAAVVDMLVRE